MTSDYLPWDAAEFAATSHRTLKKFLLPSFGLIAEPAIVVDSHGRIVLWYLPGLLLPPRQASVLY
jgi:hypothetical protein